LGSSRSISSRARILAAFLIALVAVLAFAPGAFADALTPESGGSPNADDIDSLYKVTLYIAIVVIVLVEGGLLYCLLRFRAKRGALPAQIRGNTTLEIGWTSLAGVIVVVLTVFTFLKLADIKNPARSDPAGLASIGGGSDLLYASVDQPDPPGGKALSICVNGQQYVWRFTYDTPSCDAGGLNTKAYSYDTMVVPIHTTVVLKIEAQDVAHSWWIPKLGGKADAIPGYTNKTWFKISKPGVYEGQCAELCGRNHANMLARVKAVPVADYQAWVTRQKADIDAANKAAVEQRKTLSPIQQQG
jgi:cytochrome c oxidase subunit 2